MLEIRSAGALTTVQDGVGRPDAASLGVPRGGAADPESLAVANLLLGNRSIDAGLEMTIAGSDFAVLETCVLALAGADLGATVAGSNLRLAPGHAFELTAGSEVTFRGLRPGSGARAYLALPGGVDVPTVLGSASTCLPGGFGGLDGRPFRPGDRVAARRPPRPGAGARWPHEAVRDRLATASVVRVRPGPHAAGGTFGALLDGEWDVSPTSSRAGVRLTGRTIAGGRGGLTSLPMWWGAIQLPPNGEPIVLGVDAPTVGGYPVIAVVASADRGVIGQLGPGDRVRFEQVTEEEARTAELGRRRRFTAAAERITLEPDSPWDALPGEAGAWPAGGPLDR